MLLNSTGTRFTLPSGPRSTPFATLTSVIIQTLPIPTTPASNFTYIQVSTGEIVAISITWGVIITCAALWIVYALRRFRREREVFESQTEDEFDEDLFRDFDTSYMDAQTEAAKGIKIRVDDDNP